MKIKLIALYLVLSFNLFGVIDNKFDSYFNSEVKFELLEDYRNILSSSVPEKYYRSETNEYFEFVGVYHLDEYDEIYDSFINIFGNVKDKKDGFIYFESNEEKGLIQNYKGKLWIKYLQKKN